MRTLVLLITCLLNIYAQESETEKLVTALQGGNNIEIQKKAIEQAIKDGDSIVPYLELYLTLDERDTSKNHVRGTAQYILSQIRSKNAEAVLVKCLRLKGESDWHVICSLAIYNGIDCIYGLADGWSYDCKKVGDELVYRKWWSETGRSKYLVK